jgi:hypothetical protein
MRRRSVTIEAPFPHRTAEHYGVGVQSNSVRFQPPFVLAHCHRSPCPLLPHLKHSGVVLLEHAVLMLMLDWHGG